MTGPLGSKVQAVLGWLDSDTAIFESASACAIALLRPDQLDPQDERLQLAFRELKKIKPQDLDKLMRAVAVLPFGFSSQTPASSSPT